MVVLLYYNKIEKIQQQNLYFKNTKNVMENKGRWLILDGLHRLMKATILKMNKIRVRKIPREKIPEILKFLKVR